MRIIKTTTDLCLLILCSLTYQAGVSSLNIEHWQGQLIIGKVQSENFCIYMLRGGILFCELQCNWNEEKILLLILLSYISGLVHELVIGWVNWVSFLVSFPSLSLLSNLMMWECTLQCHGTNWLTATKWEETASRLGEISKQTRDHISYWWCCFCYKMLQYLHLNDSSSRFISMMTLAILLWSCNIKNILNILNNILSLLFSYNLDTI